MSQSIVRPLRRWDPDRIGPYTLIGRLGAGAMGQVFLARSAAGRLVAVKTIRVELAEEPGFRARFAREVAAARRVSGVFTAAVVEADAEADLPWVATAYVPAPPLSALVRQCGPMPVPAVRWLAAGCAEALESIHGVGLLHRDIKPSNVLVAPDGPRVIDFGVARAAERVQLTVTRGAAGTPAYMAPEQARDATQASPASDVFSLGATLVFAATGHPPYRGETVMDILVRLATEPPDLTGVPAELAELLAACLERVPRDRPTDASILERLGPFVRGPASAAAGEPGTGHGYLPDSAMELIAGYARSPRWPVGSELSGGEPVDDQDGGEDTGAATDGSGVPVAASDGTSGSHTALPGFHSLAAGRAVPRPAAPSPVVPGLAVPGRAAPDPVGGGPRSGRGRLRGLVPGPRDGARAGSRRRFLLGTGLAIAAVALVAAGTVLGLSLRSPAKAADPGTGAGTGTGQAGPQPCVVPGSTSTPQVCVSQPYGDRNTVYVLHGSGFAPGKPVTVSLNGHGDAPYRPVADGQGTFSYAIDQAHVFFPGPIPPGTYIAVATGPDGRSASAWFTVETGQVRTPPPGQQPGPP